MAQQFRKKLVVIEAVQYTGEAGPLEEFTGGQFREVDPEDRVEDPEIVAEVFDHLHSTWVGVKLNQWVIRGVQGEYYPIDPDVLEQTYDAA